VDDTMVTCGHKTTKPAAWIVDIVKPGSHWDAEIGFVEASASPKSAADIAKAKKKKEAALAIAAEAAFKKDSRISDIIKSLRAGDETEDEIKAIKKKARAMYKAEVEKAKAEKKSSGSTGKEAGKKRKTESEQVAAFKKQIVELQEKNAKLEDQIKQMSAKMAESGDSESDSDTESEESESEEEQEEQKQEEVAVVDTLPPNTMIAPADSLAC
jgi:nucleolin